MFHQRSADCASAVIELQQLVDSLGGTPKHSGTVAGAALGQSDPLLTPHPLYQALGRSNKKRQSAYRALFRTELDREAIDDIRQAINQDQPIGNERFLARIEKMTGIRRQAKPRGRPRLKPDAAE